jgi:hypothetical protein
MQEKFIATLALLMVLACACSRQENQKQLTRRLSEANRVILLDPLRDDVTLTIRDDQLKKLVEAIETSETLSGVPDAATTYTLVFFKHSEHIATVTTGADTVFYIDRRPYGDKSGTLKAIAAKHRDRVGGPQ